MYDMHHESDIVAVGAVHGRNWTVMDDMLYAPGDDQHAVAVAVTR